MFKQIVLYKVFFLLLTGFITTTQAQAAETWYRVAYDNCGVIGSEPHRAKGDSWTCQEKDLPLSIVPADDPARTICFSDSGLVIYKYKGLAPEAKYKLRIVYLSCGTVGPRVQKIKANDTVLEEKLELPLNEVIKREYVLAPAVYADGTLQLDLERISGPNPVVSSIELLSSSKTLLPYINLKVDASVGTVKGVVTDSNIDPAEGIDVVVSLPQRGLELRTTTNGKGKFTVDIPGQWHKYKQDEIKIAAVKGKVKAVETLAIESILPVEMPQLTPRPIMVGGLTQFMLDLNGTWRFNPTPKEGFWKPDTPVDDWAYIKVPGEWVMQGFDAPTDKGVGYRRNINIPANWAGKRVKIRFDGVYSGSTLWVNGKEIGWHEGGFSPFEYDITDCVNPGKENVLALSVINDTPAGLLSNQTDFTKHPIGGITRKAVMFAVDDLNISRFHVETHFDDEYRNATMKILLNVSNQGDNRVYDAGVMLWMTGPDGNWVRLEDARVDLPTIKAGDKLEHVIRVPVKSPAKWDPEHPNLYKLYCVLRKGDKQLETVTRRIGFRQVEVRGSQIFVNNKVIKLRGIGRPDTHPLMGRSLDPGANLWRKDAEIFRAANMNYIRAIPGPPAEEFIDACDELGLFVEVEAPFCFAGLGRYSPLNMVKDAKYKPMHLQVTLEMIERDRSHPSVIIWSVGNESKWEENFIASGKASKKADPTRPLLISAWTPNHDGGMLDIGVVHYPGRYGGHEQYANYPRPVIYDEYCHVMCYNQTELLTDPGLREYWGTVLASQWESLYASKSFAGGALWAAIDDIFLLPTGMTTPYVGYGKWGPIDGWRRKKPEYWHVKKTYSPIRIFQRIVDVPAKGQPINIEVHNRYDFNNLNEVKTTWQIGSETGTVELDIEPKTKGTLAIKPKQKDLAGKELVLKFNDSTGFLVDTFKLPIGETADVEQARPAGKPKLIQNNDTITIKSPDGQWVIDKKTGLIQKGIYKGKTVVTGGPTLMANPLKEDDGWPKEPSNVMCSNWKLEKFEVERSGDEIIVRSKGQYDQAGGVYTMRFDGNGRVSIDYSFEYKTDVSPREIGIVFDVAKDFDTLTWKRKGVWTSYPDSHIGRNQGQAKAFRGDDWPEIKKHTAPPWPWALDSTPQGTNDFRSSKRNIIWAKLHDQKGVGLKVESDGRQTTRSYVDTDSIRLLVAYYSNDSTEPYCRYRPPGVLQIKLSTGSVVTDSVKLQLSK